MAALERFAIVWHVCFFSFRANRLGFLSGSGQRRKIIQV